MKKPAPRDLIKKQPKPLDAQYSEVLKLREQLTQAQSNPPVKRGSDDRH